MEVKAVSYIDLEILSKEYKDFLLHKFELGNLFPDSVTPLYFLGWKGTQMFNWYKVINTFNRDWLFEIFPNEYKIHVKNNIYSFPFPRNLNDFISDCDRIGINLYWNTEELDKIFDTKIYMPIKDIEIYYKDLLTKIGKADVF